jgi:glycine hydroxymethyltransferase
VSNRLPSTFTDPLSSVDPEIAAAPEKELGRQRDSLALIAGENFVPRAVLESAGSVLTNKYAEGYPGRRYYGGCEFVDVAEQLAIDRAKALFGAEYANVQPHSGATANAAVLSAIATPGDTILGLELAHGGHLTHGMKLNFSGKLYNAVSYGVDPETFLVDMDVVREKALEHKPAVIIAGWSAYPRQLDFAAFRAVADEVGAKLWVDMAHFAGLVAAGLHPSPVPHADVVSSTVHKTLGGPRSGVIFSRDKETFGKKLDSAVFPGQQGGPLMHVIAAKATAFKLAATEEFRDRQERTIRGAQILADRLTASDAKDAGVDVLTGGTDVHLVLVDLRTSQFTGKEAEDRLHEVGITVNKNAVPFDPRPPMVTSGLRIGTPALATRGFGDEAFTEVADVIALALKQDADVPALRARVKRLTDASPLYPGLGPSGFPVEQVELSSSIQG